ncbi:hypothetical protein AB0K67_38105 [Nonomuraea sp. NPDC052634]
MSVVTDAVAGVREEYAQAVLRYTIGLLATRTATAELIKAWT